MDRFVAMIWDPADISRTAYVEALSQTLARAREPWRQALDAPGLRVLLRASPRDEMICAPWDGGDGVIIGALFKRGEEDKGRVRKVPARHAEQGRATKGQNFIDNFWGNYVALWRDRETRRVFVLRDPCGGVPCFITSLQSVDLVFAHAGDIAEFPGMRLHFDWDYLQAFLFFNYFVTKHTGLCEIKEVLAGERLEWSPRGAEYSWAWNAATIAANPKRHNFDDAKQELRGTTEACFAAWGSCYRKVIVSLSGGLDSSILVNLLSRSSGAEVIALHYLGQDYEAYEAKYARLAAAHADIELIEIAQEPAEDDVRRILAAPKLARPKMQSLSILIDDVSASLADRLGADAFMIGQGGDNLFLQRGSAKHTLGDYIRLCGLGSDFTRIAYDAAMLQQQSVWTIMQDALGDAVLRPPWRPYDFLNSPAWIEHRPLTREAAGQISAAYMSHPWFADAVRLPRGKADHVMSIVALYNYYIDHGRAMTRDVVYPLFSQPIAECALQTPTYLLCGGGVDRALERAAFADIIPPEIRRRVGKGGADSYLLRVMQNNMGFYRELILDGAIIKTGWLAREKIEAMLSPGYVVAGAGAYFIYLLVAAEAWLHTWDQDRNRAAA